MQWDEYHVWLILDQMTSALYSGTLRSPEKMSIISPITSLLSNKYNELNRFSLIWCNRCVFWFHIFIPLGSR